MLNAILHPLLGRRQARRAAHILDRIEALREAAAHTPLPVTAFRRPARRPLLGKLFAAAKGRRLAA